MRCALIENNIVIPFGKWPSNLTTAWMGSGIGLSDPQWSAEKLIWLEKRSDRSALVRYDSTDGYRDLTFAQKIRGGLFYGGGDFHVRNNLIVFVDKDGQLFLTHVTGGAPELISAPAGASAAPMISPDGKFVLFVNSYDDIDRLMIVSLENSTHSIHALAAGADFYMQPVWHPDGKKIAWVEWSHPQMPWQGARLIVASFDPYTGSITEKEHLSGNEAIPVFQPEFSPDGKWIAWLENQGEWDGLMIASIEELKKREILGGKSMLIPAWLQGIRVMSWSPDSRHIYVIGNEKGFSELWQVNIQTGAFSSIYVDTYTHLSQISVNPLDGRIALQASSPKHTPRLIIIDGSQLSVVRSGMPEIISPGELPEAQPVSWTTEAGIIHGILYLPSHGELNSEGLPPVILHVHSGPTSQVQANFSADTAFFTSRGYAYLSVNYRGSTGFGRSYREALDYNWGLSDVEDTLSAVTFLQESGKVDPNRIVLKGSSAGGFTVLNTLIRFPGKFRAAICAYGVANLSTIVEETFKFESHYYDSLIGPLNESTELMRERSPINKAASICDPILLFHGSEDPVVPVSQTEEIVQQLIQNGTPYQYVRFENEGHGWRNGETLEAYYRTIEEFLDRYCLN